MRIIHSVTRKDEGRDVALYHFSCFDAQTESWVFDARMFRDTPEYALVIGKNLTDQGARFVVCNILLIEEISTLVVAPGGYVTVVLNHPNYQWNVLEERFQDIVNCYEALKGYKLQRQEGGVS